MDGNELTYADYARFARQTAAELERDCRFEAFHASGPGGQGVNTADSAVRLEHLPTGIVCVSRESRSQYRNRRLALAKLRAELLRRAAPPLVRRSTRPTHASVLKRLIDKRRRSELKARRRPPEADE